MRKLLNKLFILAEGQFVAVKRLLRGTSKTPLLYLGIISVILFCGSALIMKTSVSKPLSCEDFFLADASQAFGKSAKNDLFASPVEKFSPESPELMMVENCSLKAASPPTKFSPIILGSIVDGIDPESKEKEIIEYVVEPGDTIASIASKFDISSKTILWANNLSSGSSIKPGKTLIVLPVSGVIYHIKKGDILSEVAKQYKGNTEEIVVFNELSDENDLFVGDIIVIPNGILPATPVKNNYATTLIPLANSYFICPISSPCRRTQGLHWYNAVDLSHGKCGEPIYSVAAGQVLKVKQTDSISRSVFGGAGNTVTILHPNGVVTSYGHLASIAVKPGDIVSQGQIIGSMGGKPGTPGAGNSTGCHIHFGVSGATNPFK